MNSPKEPSNPQRLRFLTSAADMQGCPNDNVPEVAIVGRSNAGKSSLINGLANSRVAKISSTPGKTRLLNFYQAESYRVVDMPGYGFASRGSGEQRSWQEMIEPYLGTRNNLVGLIIVMDVRREWTQDENNLLEWMSPRDLPSLVALTKTDKLSRTEILKRQKLIHNQCGLEHLMLTSALKRQGFDELETFVYMNWVRPAKRPTKKKPVKS